MLGEEVPPMQTTRNAYAFVLVFEPAEKDLSTIENVLFESGLDDALLGKRHGAFYLDVEREASSFEEALHSAIEQLESASIGARLVRVEPDDMVTMAEIARRAGKSREAVRLWVEGERGPGNFPVPQAGLTGTTRLWSWRDVLKWLLASGAVQDEGLLLQAQAISRLNAALDEKYRKNV
jgi:hypothetical protein